jgi:putative transposase
METYVSGHGIYKLEYHVVWVCKYRRRILKPGVTVYVEKLIRGLLKSMPGVKLEAIGFDLDHIHMVMVIPPKYSISDCMATLKSQSASRLRKKFTWLEKVYWKENIVWSPGYFVSSIGINESIIKHYVEHQGRQDEDQQQVLL